jgi:hypothetical protein
MTSSVIINFGSNASALFRDMQKVKAEVRSVAKQATVATREMAKVSQGPGMFQRFKSGLGGLRFGAGLFTGFLGVNIIREVMNPMIEGFKEVTKTSKEMALATEIANEGLKKIGGFVGKTITSGPVMDTASAIASSLIPGLPPLSILSAARQAMLQEQELSAARQAMLQEQESNKLLTGPQYTSPISAHPAIQRLIDVQQKQLVFARDQLATLHRMENDLDRMNSLDPW